MPYQRRGGGAYDPYARYLFGPADRNYLAESAPAWAATGATAPATAGRCEFVKIKIPSACSVANMVMFSTAGGTALTANQCLAYLFAPDRTLIGTTANQATAWATNGLYTMALGGGPYACAPGTYFAGFHYNGTTSPSWARTAAIGSFLVNAGLATPNLAVGFADTGLTTAAPSTLGAQTAQNAPWWVALS
jgi:hypothetical protein